MQPKLYTGLGHRKRTHVTFGIQQSCLSGNVSTFMPIIGNIMAKVLILY